MTGGRGNQAVGTVMAELTVLCMGLLWLFMVYFIIYTLNDIWNFYDDDFMTHRIHGAAIYGNMDPINIPKC